MVGKRSARLKGFVLLWEQARPPKLRIIEQIKGKSLDELEDLISRFSQDYTGSRVTDSGIDVSEHKVGNEAHEGDDYNYTHPARPARASRGIMAQFAWQPCTNRGRESVFSKVSSINMTRTSSSEFILSNSKRE